MLRSRAERPGWESLCAPCCTSLAHVEPAPRLARVSSLSAGSERPWAPRRAGDPLQWLCHPPGCRAGQEAFPTPWLHGGTNCSVDWLRTDKISWIFRSGGAGWGDPHPPSWFRFPCFCLEEQTWLWDSLPWRTAWPGCCSWGRLQNSQNGCRHSGGFDFTSTPDPRVVILPAAGQICSVQPRGRERSLKKPPGVLSPRLLLASSTAKPGCPEGK